VIYLELFISFFQVGILSFGGGYAALPLIQRQVVDVRGWVTMTQFSDIITISQMTPGPIALNMASFVGTQMGGIAGTVIATVSVVTGPLVLALMFAIIYYRYRELSVMKGILWGLKPTVVSLIATAGIGIFTQALFTGESPSSGSIGTLLLFAAGGLLLVRGKLTPVKTILFSGLFMVLWNLVQRLYV